MILHKQCDGFSRSVRLFYFLPAALGVKNYVISNSLPGDVENYSGGFSVLPLSYVHNKLFCMDNWIL